jgi:quinol monooxygenase YgiN
MAVIAIAAYRPRAGKEKELLQAVRDHMPVLRGEHLITNRAPYVMRADDGTIVEVFEWNSDDAIEQAHSNPEVLKLWGRFNAACEYIPLVNLAECKEMFANFEPLDL